MKKRNQINHQARRAKRRALIAGLVRAKVLK